MAAQEDSQVAESARSLQLNLNRSESKPFLVAKVAVSSPETLKSGRPAAEGPQGPTGSLS
jgi:hypothetical protein